MNKMRESSKMDPHFSPSLFVVFVYFVVHPSGTRNQVNHEPHEPHEIDTIETMNKMGKPVGRSPSVLSTAILFPGVCP